MAWFGKKDIELTEADLTPAGGNPYAEQPVPAPTSSTLPYIERMRAQYEKHVDELSMKISQTEMEIEQLAHKLADYRIARDAANNARATLDDDDTRRHDFTSTMARAGVPVAKQFYEAPNVDERGFHRTTGSHDEFAEAVQKAIDNGKKNEQTNM